MSLVGGQLRFGDCVVISGFKEKKNPTDDKAQSSLRGLMTSQGFGQDLVYLESFDMNMADDNESRVISIKNYRDCVFQIWPKLDFEAHKEQKKLQKSKIHLDKQKQQDGSGDDDFESKKDLEQYYLDVLDKLKKVGQRCEAETVSNFNQIEHAKGKTVTYGQELFFMHQDSGSFLNGQVSCSNSDQSAYKFELSSLFNKGMVFKIQPRYKLRQEGEHIQYKDYILLLNSKLNSYVNFNNQGLSLLDQPLPPIEKPYYQDVNVIRGEGRERHECYVSNQTDTTWQLLFYRSLPDSQVFHIFGHQLVYLKHTETQGLLSADQDYLNKTDSAQVYLRDYQGNEQEEKFSAFSIWELEKPTNFSRGEALVLSTRINDISKGGKVIYEQNKFILRHFITGRVLQCLEVIIDGKKKMIPCLNAVDNILNAANSQIQFISTAGEEKEIMENNICYVLVFQNFQLSVNSSCNYQNKANSEKKPPLGLGTGQNFAQITPEQFFTPLEDSEFVTAKYHVYCDDKGTQEENAFQILRLEEDVSKDIYLIVSQISIISKYASMIKAKLSETTTNKDVINQVQQALTKLIFFVSKSHLEPTIENVFLIHGVPIQSRQRLVRDFRIIEHCMDILYYPFKNGLANIDKLNEVDEEFLRLLQLSYKCVMMTIKEYRPNELYASQWLNLMINQAKVNVHHGDIGAEETLTELLDNNRLLLETKITEKTIKQFIDMLVDEKIDKYVEMVYALCVCNETAMIFNQGQVSELVLNDPEILTKLIYPITEKNGRIEISPGPHGQAVELKNFKINSLSQDNGENYLFFLQMINLTGGLCLGRNYLAIDPLQDIYPLGLCHMIISSFDFDLGLRTKMIRLIIHLWVDRAPYAKIVLPDRVRIWNDIDEQDDSTIPCTRHDFSKLQKLKNFVLDELHNESDRGYTKIQDTERNHFIFEVLQLLKMMIEFGFYQSSDEINQVMEPMMKILKGVYDVSNQEEEQFINGWLIHDHKNRQHIKTKRLITRYEDDDTNIIIHKTKKTICQILNFMVKLRESTRLSYILKEFKKDTLKIQKDVAKVSSTVKRSQVAPYHHAHSSVMEYGASIDAIEYAKLPLQWIDYLINKHKIDFEGVQEIDLTLILLDLTLYKFDELVNMSFSFVNALYTQRFSMIQSIREVQLLEDDNQIKVFHQLHDVGVELGELMEKSEQWLWKEDPKQQASALKVVGFLEIIASTLLVLQETVTKQEPDDEESLIEIDQFVQQHYKFSNQKSSQLFGYGESSNSFTQDLIRNTCIYEQILQLLEFDAEQFTYKRIHNSKDVMDPTSPSFKTIKLCYMILGRFCYLCPENQALLLPHVEEVFLKHLRYLPNVGQYVMLEPFLHDNRSILQNPELLQVILKELVRTINGLPLNDSLKPSYFKCLKELTKLKGKVLKANQTMIINEITSHEFLDIIVTYQDDFPIFENEIQQLESAIEKAQQNTTVVVSSRLDYFNGFIHLMGIICEDKNNATESKTQNYFPLSHFMRLIDATNECWYVLKNLMFFFFHVYLDTERELTDELLDIKKILINKVKLHVKEVASQEMSSTREVTLLNFKGPMTMKEVREDYFFNALILCAETIVNKRMIDDFDMREQFYQTMVQSLLQISKQIENKKYKQITKNFFALLISIGALNDEQLKSQVTHDLIPNQQLIAQAKRGQGNVHASTKELRVSSMSLHAEKLKKRCEIVFKREEFRQEANEEINSLIQKILSIEENSKKEFKGACTIHFNEIIKSMIEFTEKNVKIDNNLTVLRLQIFQKLIERSNRDCLKSILEWESDDYEQNIQFIVKAQNQMVELGIVKMLYQIMKDEHLPQCIFIEAIHLSIALLLGGNKMAQDAFYDELTHDNSNSVFINMKQRLERGFDQIKKSMGLLNKQLFEQLLAASNDQYHDENDELDIEDQEVVDDKLPETIEEEDKDSMVHVVRIMRMLQLFCEGHNLDMQNYLRQQVINTQVLGRNYDFIYNSAVQFATYVKFVNVHSLELGNQILDFIMESVQGPCSGNQVKLVGAKIIDSCKDLMQKFQVEGDFKQFGFHNEQEVQSLQSVIKKSNKLLLALIEGKSDQQIFHSMAQSLDFDLLLEELKEQYHQFKKSHNITSNNIQTVMEKVGDKFDPNMMDNFCIYILLEQLQGDSEYLRETLLDLESLESNEGELSEAIQFFKSATKSIEVLFKDDLITVYFPVQPICYFLSKSTRTRIMTDAPRESPSDKIESLLEEAEGVFDEIEHMAYLEQLPLYFSQSRLSIIRDISTIVAVVINLLMLITYHKELDPSNYQQSINVTDKFNCPTQEIITYLGYAQLVLSSLILIFWIFIYSPLLLTLKWRNFLQSNQRDQLEQLYLLAKYEDNDDISPDDLPLSLTLKLLNLKGPTIPLFNRGIIKNFGNNHTLMMYWWRNFVFILGDAQVAYLILYISISFIGTFISEIVFALHLLDIIDRFPTLQNVIKAITTNSRQLVLTTLLGLIFMYVWAIVGFFFLDDMFQLNVYDASGAPVVENQCTTMLQCFIVVVDQGLILGGGVGDFLAVQSFEEANSYRYGIRWFYDILFFMIVKMAFLNIIFGIIIDTFADLRDKRNIMEEDMKNVCYICGIERGQFDQFADGFENHIVRDHDLWNYIYYLYHLKLTNKTDMNGVESYVSQKYEAHDQSWVPLLRAKSIKQKDNEDDDETKLNAELDNIQQVIKGVTQSLDRLQKKD